MRLWNAHRRVYHKRKLLPSQILDLEKKQDGWRELVTEDVVKFVDELKAKNLAGGEEEQRKRISQITRDPAGFFSRPRNVPLVLRQQVYLPDFKITLMRTPHLAPKYASFWVPLSFNKLDFKSFLKNVYKVDVLHIRSYVQQQKVRREERQIGKFTRQGQGRLYRPPARKKMTVELVDPFVYPEEENDLAPWEAETYKRELKEQRELTDEMSDQASMAANTKHRDSIGQQAQNFLEGKQRWKPSWQSIPADARILQSTSRPPGLRGTV